MRAENHSFVAKKCLVAVICSNSHEDTNSKNWNQSKLSRFTSVTQNLPRRLVYVKFFFNL